MSAADAPRSAASADSYIGSLISLTSKCEIRYEGVLYNINTQESSIGLRNVQSFGTEGRKKDGPQIPSSDKIYEYILFRGSDIKDLQVKSSPPIQTAPLMPNDPAIIQSHYPRPTSASTSMPSNGSGYVADLISQTGEMGMPRATFPGGLPTYQPPGSLGSWGSSPTPPNANGSGLSMPMYWQGFYTPGGLSHLHQPPLLRPPGLQMPPSMQQPQQYSMPPLSANLFATDASLPSGLHTLSGENSSISTTVSSFPKPSSPLFPLTASLPSGISPPLFSSTSLASGLPGATMTGSLPLTSSIPKHEIDSVSTRPAPIPGLNVSYQAIAHSMPTSTTGLSNSTQGEILTPPLLTPAQLLQSGVPSISSSLPQTSPKVSEKKLKAAEPSKEALIELKPTVVEYKEPILPTPPDQKANGASVHAYNHHRNRGRGRGRGNELARSATRFTEDFDFNAMNEKFNKEEVWGHLGKSNGLVRERDKDPNEYSDNAILQEYATESSKTEVKPVYIKDDFFDTLSCHSLMHANRITRAKFSEQRKIDTETFGNFQRDHLGPGGGHGFRGGWTRGSFRGRGYGYAGRGRGYYSNYRA